MKLQEKISEKDKEINDIENNYKEKITKLEEQINTLKKEKNNLLNEINENQDKINEYEAEIINLKNDNDRINNEINQVNIGIQNKDSVIEQLKQQIEALNQVLVQSEEDLKTFEENKQEEIAEYNNQIELLIQEKNILEAQNIELTENLSLANENLKKINELVADKYSNIEAELFKQTNKNEILEKKYRGVLKKMKSKQNLLNQEKSKLKDYLNNKDINEEQLDINTQNKIQNISLYNAAMGNRSGISQVNTNNISNQTMYNLDVNKNNLINNYDNQENLTKNINYNNSNNLNYTFDYNALNGSYLDPKEAGQKRTLNEFKKLLNRIDEKLDMV